MSTENKYQFKGTPGEWEYQRDADDYTHIVRAGRKFMCQLQQDRTGESKANARLIAAAPELLQACLAAWEHINCSYPEGQEAVSLVKQAIHKALNITE